MDDRPEWERALDQSQGDVDSSGDVVSPAVWRAYVDQLPGRSLNVLDGSAAHSHQLLTGHPMRFGCCGEHVDAAA